ncbi:Pkinase-domain-containing protein [Lentinula guzmanii]|uniref:mitogen-activated protein kinase kinase kinase n=1 Tax=Lentinula guzmanii TaxID=2804957 RepID=A0AA38JM13_9AGAR|nr:Pkinase-domain-containing protein [Lentinula guzmanii]
MAAVAVNGLLHTNAADIESPPASPSFQFQAGVARSFVPNIRGQTSPFPTTPTTGQMPHLLDPPAGVPYAEYIRTWTDGHVARWLSDIKCGHHADTFSTNDIRGDILLELDQITLQEMEITSIGDRLRILAAVKALRLRTAKSSSVIQPSRLNVSIDSINGQVPEISPTTRKRTVRPAPLHLNQAIQNDLPRIIREQPDSARSVNASSVVNYPIRPLPHPNTHTPNNGTPVTTTSTGSSSGPTPISNHSNRTNLPPLPPPPRGQPPPPPTNRTPARSNINGANGRRTPTPGENTPNRDLLSPSPSNWAGYHLPADPRPGNPGGGKTPQSSRSTSPLPARPNSRNGSTSVSVTTSPNNKRGPTGGMNHPYSSGLQAPNTQGIINLSPIQEQFTNPSGISPPNQNLIGNRSFNPATPSHSNAPSLEDLRRKLVKFSLPDEHLTYTIDVDTCVGGVEILERVLKKFGKGGGKGIGADPDAEGALDHVTTEDGGLSVDGWGVYLENGTGDLLSEGELLSVCHAPLDHPTRENPLILRRIARARRDGNVSPAQPKFTQSTSKATKRASSYSILNDLGVRDPERALVPPSPTTSLSTGRLSPASANTNRPSKLRNFFGQRPPSELITNHLTEFFPNTEKKVLERTKRQSMMSRSNTASSRMSRISRTSTASKRDSVASWNPSLPSRFSSSTQGSAHTRRASSHYSPRASLSSPPPPLPDKTIRDDASIITTSEEVPRMSLSTEDGQSVDLDREIEDVSGRHQIDKPQLLPPIPFPSESFSESLENLTGADARPGARMSRASSNASYRLSFMTELRSRRDRSDTASLMTVDEITKEMENRQLSKRESMVIRPPDSSDTDEWTEIENEEGTSKMDLNQDKQEDEDYDDDDDDDTYLDDEGSASEEADDEDDDGAAGDAAKLKKITNKWIKGALIGAGSFGKVYLGMDASTGRLMAVKQVELPTGSAPNLERKQSMLTALEHEIELLQDLQHENIVQYLYSTLEDDCLNIFLEYVPGGSVTALLRNYGAFEETLVSNFTRQISQGLIYLHERGIIHRDIKGANILVDNKGGVKISDFGISKKVDVQALTGARVHRPSLQGSVFWMAPEVVKQSAHTQKADIWSVGCLVVEMLTGEHPWAQLTQMQAIFKIGSSAKPTIPSDISSDARDFLTRTFEVDYEARPSASDLLQHPFITRKP